MIRAHVLTYYFIFHTQYLTSALQAMQTAPDHDRFSVRKTSTLKEYLSLLPLPWQPTTAQLNPPHIFIFKFYPVLTCISMETCRSSRARWRIARRCIISAFLIGQSPVNQALCERSITVLIQHVFVRMFCSTLQSLKAKQKFLCLFSHTVSYGGRY